MPDVLFVAQSTVLKGWSSGIFRIWWRGASTEGTRFEAPWGYFWINMGHFLFKFLCSLPSVP